MTKYKLTPSNKMGCLKVLIFCVFLTANLITAQEKEGAEPEWKMTPNWDTRQLVDGSWTPLQLSPDKKMDYLNIFSINVNSKTGNQVVFQAYISNGDGTYDKKNFWPTYQTQNIKPEFGDVNGDGIADVIYNLSNSNSTFRIQTYINQGDGTWKKIPLWNGTKLDFGDYYWFVTDVNNDSKDDLVRYFNKGGDMSFGTFISNGDGSYQPEVVWDTNRNTTGEWLSIDIDDDGKTDVANLWDLDSKEIFTMYFANGDGTYRRVSDYHTGKDESGRWSPLDVNGDGKMDIVNFWTLDGDEVFTTYFSLGNGSWNLSENWHSGRDESGSWVPADVNGDGKTDIVNFWDYEGTQRFSMYLSNGNGTWNNISDYNTGKDPGGDWKLQDVNGDGKTDIVNVWNYFKESQLFQTYISEID
ncbi:MAG: hypothetical protein SCALA702_04270 [Melioribacteraceae bacterium]|nr:MAG: hypothetical protein SCALA702_04270 [Melioribacteraceae bacterium]